MGTSVSEQNRELEETKFIKRVLKQALSNGVKNIFSITGVNYILTYVQKENSYNI